MKYWNLTFLDANGDAVSAQFGGAFRVDGNGTLFVSATVNGADAGVTAVIAPGKWFAIQRIEKPEGLT